MRNVEKEVYDPRCVPTENGANSEFIEWTMRFVDVKRQQTETSDSSPSHYEPEPEVDCF